jgi:hypothetical protein
MTKYDILKIYWPTNDKLGYPLKYDIVKQTTYKEAYAFCNDDNNRFESKEYFYGFQEQKK